MFDSPQNPTDLGGVELAQAGGSGAEPVGQITALQGSAFIIRTDGTKVQASDGAPIFQGDTIETAAKGAVGITFADQSTFSLADEGQMVIDEMVYDPGTQSGKSAISVAEGIFTFVSGQIAKTDVGAMTISTPVATIGIRGTSGGGQAAAEGTPNTFTMFADPGGGTGEMIITTQGGAQTLNSPNQTTQITSAFVPPTIPVTLPAAAVARFYANARAVAPPVPTGEGATGQGAAEGGPIEGGPTEGQALTPEEAAAAEAEAEAAAAAAAAEAEAEAMAAEAATLAAEAEAAATLAAEAAAAAAAATLAAEAETAAAAAAAQTAEAEAAQAEAVAAEAQLAAAAAVAEAAAQALAAAPGGPGGFSAPAEAIEAGEQAFEQALAAGGSLEDAMAAAVNGAGEAGLNAVLAVNADHFGTTGNDVMDNIVNSVLLNVTGAIDPLSAGTGAGTGFNQFTTTMFFEDALAVIDNDLQNVVEDFFSEGFDDLFGGEAEDFFDAFFDDPFADFEDSFAFDTEFGFEDDLGPDDDFFDLGEVFDFLDEDVEFVPPLEPMAFDEILVGTVSSDTLAGSGVNTNYFFSESSIGGSDTITDAGGINQIAFDSLNDTVIKFTIDGSVTTTGSVEIWGTTGQSGNIGGDTSGGSNATYTLTNSAYNNGTGDSTISFNNVGQYLFADTTTSILSGGFSTHTEEDLSGTPTEADSGDVIVMPALEAGDIGYVVAGGSGADTFNLDDSAMDGVIVFGKGGGDTFNVTTQMDSLLIGGITSTDNNDTNSDNIPDQNLNIFDYSTLLDASNSATLGTNAIGLNATIFGFFDSFDNKFETTAVVNYVESSVTSMNNILWDVGHFIGSAGKDTIALIGAKINEIEGGTGIDTITADVNSRFLTLDGGAGNDTLTDISQITPSS